MIPRIVHLCFGLTPDFGGKPWGLVHYACVRSILERVAPETIFLHYAYEPKGPWWSLTRPLVSLNRIEPPESIFGQPIRHPAHKADVVRLRTLIDQGGIYLDCDVLALRAFDDLLTNQCVLGDVSQPRARPGLCNAVILAEPQAEFLRIWLDEYRTFDAEKWDHHSVLLPARLAESHPHLVRIMPQEAFFSPSWKEEDIKRLYAREEPVSDPAAYAHHLWENIAWPFFKDLTVSKVRKRDTAFHGLLRPLLKDLPDDFGLSIWGRARAFVSRRSS